MKDTVCLYDNNDRMTYVYILFDLVISLLGFHQHTYRYICLKPTITDRFGLILRMNGSLNFKCEFAYLRMMFDSIFSPAFDVLYFKSQRL